MKQHLRLFESLEDYNNAELSYPSVVYLKGGVEGGGYGII